MATLKAANVTKYDAGGSGDNIISDGFIKTVEKVWIDSYAATPAIGSDDSIKIGRVPANKKITDIIIMTPSLMSAASNCTIFLDSGATMIMTSANTYLGAAQADGVAAGTETFDANVIQTLRLTGDKHATVTAADTDIYMKIVMSGGVDTDVLTGTIRTIIKYT